MNVGYWHEGGRQCGSKPNRGKYRVQPGAGQSAKPFRNGRVGPPRHAGCRPRGSARLVTRAEVALSRQSPLVTKDLRTQASSLALEDVKRPVL